MTRNRVGAAMFAGVMVGILMYKTFLPHSSPQPAPPSPAIADPTPSLKIDPVYRPIRVPPAPKPKPTATPQPSVSPVASPQPKLTPSPAPSPQPSPSPDLLASSAPTFSQEDMFPPPMSSCKSADPAGDLANANRALESGDRYEVERLFERAAVCGSRYALIVGSLYDPAQTVSRQTIHPDPRKAIHFYAYAAAQGGGEKALERLNDLREWARGNESLIREIDALRYAIGR